MIFPFFLIIIFFLFVLLVFFSTIRIDINKLNISNIEKEKLEYDYLIYIKLYILKYIKIFQVRIDKNFVNKRNILNKLNFKKMNSKFNNIKLSLNSMKFEIEKFNLDLKIGTDVVFITSLLVLVFSVFISYLFAYIFNKVNFKNYKYKIEPIYSNDNLINLKFNCIIKIQMVHIIKIIYIIFKGKKSQNNIQILNIMARKHDKIVDI